MSYTFTSSEDSGYHSQVRIRLKSPTTTVTKATTTTKTRVKQWEERLVEKFEGKIQLSSTKVKQDTLKDARYLFGGAGLKKRLTLRTAAQMRRGNDIVLPQFDPNFLSPAEVSCRMVGCSEKKPRNSAAKVAKEDLYLCPVHRGRMVDYVNTLCSKQDVHVTYGSGIPGDFDGYTSLIGFMERAYYCSVRPSAGGPRILRNSPKIVREVFLNVRNFLFITNAVLNPDPENLDVVLPPVMTIMEMILERIGSVEFVTNLAFLLRDVMETILFAFGVIYTWVSLALIGNPGAHFGMGVGGVLGAGAAGAMFGGPAGVLIGLGVGLLCGGMIGGGYYNHQLLTAEQQRQDEGLLRYREFMRQPVAPQAVVPANQPQPQPDFVYHFAGNAWGDIALAALLVEVLLIL